MSRHIADRAGFIASLSKNDPERVRAEEHALSCPTCRAAMDEGARLMILLRAAVPQAGPTPSALAHAAEIISKENDDERQSVRRVTAAALVAVTLAWLFQLMVGSGFVVNVRQVVGSLSVFAVALMSVTLLRGKERWALPLVVGTSVVFALTTGTGAALQASVGIRCSFREIWAAAIAWALVAGVARQRRLRIGRWNLAGVAAAGALAAHAGQHLACEVPHSEAHVFVFHVSVVALVAGLGALSAAWPLSRPAGASAAAGG